MTAKPSPRDYAPLAPIVRAVIPRLVTGERIREITAQPSLEEAVNLLRDTMYGDALKSKTLKGIQRDLATFYAGYALRLKRMAPVDAYPLIDAFLHELEAGDLLGLALYSYTRAGGLPDILTSGVPGSLPARIAGDPEAYASLARLLERLQGSWAERYTGLIRRVAEAGDPSRIPWARVGIVAGEYSRALESLDPRLGKPLAARAVCPLLNWMIAALLIEAKRAGLESRLIEELLVDVPACRFRVKRAREVYEREPGAEALASVAEEVADSVKLDSSKPLPEALEEARAEARRRSARGARSILSSYPFHAGLTAAGLMLVKLNVEDLVTVLTGIALKLVPEEYLPYTVYA